MVDLAHLNERGFWDVSEVYDGPLVSTHTAVHELAPSPRNLTDEQLREIQETDGVAGITFHVGDLREDGEVNSNTSISTLADHFEYIANEVGVRHVAFGSDFEGGTMPDELSDAGELQKLVEELRDRGFGKEELRKICHENWIRVLRETWQKS